MKLSERIKMLEKLGVNTSKYRVSLGNVVLTSEDEIENMVKPQFINNNKLFRRWITAQTFKMIYEPSYNEHYCKEYGWNNYLKNRYSYMYQFDMLKDELKVLAKLELVDREEFEIRSRFFTKEVVYKTCDHYLKQLRRYYKNNCKTNGEIKLKKYGVVTANDYLSLSLKLRCFVDDIATSCTYNELKKVFDNFYKCMNPLPTRTSKCSEWKDAFKGSGGYYTLKNLVMFHDVRIKDCPIGKEVEKLDELLDDYQGAYWKFNYLLINTIEYNNFNLKRSISEHS